MSRTIKFRAWDKTYKEMYYPYKNEQEWWWDSDEHSIKFAVNSPCPPEIHLEFSDGELELMQYTGLKDSEGKEIYEGDIVEGNSWTCSGMGLAELVKCKWEITFEYAKWYTRLIYKKDGRDVSKPDLYFHEDLKIIGNIYENPELLENKE